MQHHDLAISFFACAPIGIGVGRHKKICFMGKPAVSFVVLSYNNSRFLRRTIDSILSQTISDFDVIVLDDASTDNSVEILRSYADDRIKLYIHEQNRGLTPSYNEAIALCQGDFIVNLDSDDAIAPIKTELQLAAFASQPVLDVVGTYINLIDENDQVHPDADLMEAITNRPHNFNQIQTWVVQNNLVRSSTMMRKSLHQRVGPNEIGMVRAPDYDLWTRALRAGGKFHVIPERLTYYRLHAQGLTYGDPRATFLELSYSLIRHIVPLIEESAEYEALAKAVFWMVENPQFKKLDDEQRYRLIALMMRGGPPESYAEFTSALNGNDDNSQLILEGRRILFAIQLNPLVHERDKLLEQIGHNRDELAWHAQQAENWQNAYNEAITLNNAANRGLAESRLRRVAYHLRSLIRKR